jgi:hypothetical protein
MKPPLPPWPFDQAPNVAAVTSTHITVQRLPILLVTHYEDDDSWGFQSGRPVTTADAQVVAMKTIVEIDPSVDEIASLAPGYSAVRESVGGEWKITKDEWTHGEQ